MRLLSLAEIQTLEPGEIVPSFRAQLKEVRKYSTGDGQYGPWTLQPLVMMDSTGIMQVKSKNKEEFTKSEVGKWFLFECVSGKDGLVGIKVAEDTYQGKTTKVIQITKTCTVLDGSNGPQEADHLVPKDKPHLASEPETRSVTLRTPDPRPPSAMPDTAQAILDVRERLGKAANGLIMAYSAAVYIAEQVRKLHPDVVFGPSELERIAVHLSISLEKNGAVHGLPTGPLSKWLKAKAPEPEPEPEPPDDPDEPPF